MNTELIKLLQELAEIAAVHGQTYREAAYRKVVNNIKKIKFKLTSENFMDLKIPGVGKGIGDKILEYLHSGKITDLIDARKDKKILAHNIFSKILGVGPSTIAGWIDQRIYTLASLKLAVAEGSIKLTNMQKWGLKYYKDLSERIPRTETTAIATRIKKTLVYVSPDIIFEVAGSYRRGLQTSGDVDILISSMSYDADLLRNFEHILQNDSGYVATLSIGPERITFLYKWDKVRQIDILNIGHSSYYAALLYFTGSYEFNQYMRGVAKQKGFRLNQTGLYKILRGGKLELIRTESETEIFAILGLKYIEPHARL